MEFKFNVGDNVVYKKDTPDSKLATIFKKRYNVYNKKFTQEINCMSLMCSRECCGYFDESDIINN